MFSHTTQRNKKTADLVSEGLFGSSAFGVAHALYDINANGEVVEWADVDGDGVAETAKIDTDGDGVADYTRNNDGNLLTGNINEIDDNGDETNLVDEGVLDWVVAFFSDLFLS